MIDKPTCGVLYKAGLDRWTGQDEAAVRLFAAGFVSGQAEKVYLGACRAAMFRPSADRRPMLDEVIADVAARYGLLVEADADEVWLCRDEQARRTVCEMQTRAKDSPGYHRLRGMLCGIPAHQIDEAFHQRRGYGERCD